MKVWVVTENERGEGGSVVGVFDTKQKADDWIRSKYSQATDATKDEEGDYWISSIDYLQIEEWEVK